MSAPFPKLIFTFSTETSLATRYGYMTEPGALPILAHRKSLCAICRALPPPSGDLANHMVNLKEEP